MNDHHKPPSVTKQKLDDLLDTFPAGNEHTEPTRAMLAQTSYACNGAEDKPQALSDALGAVAYFLAMVHRSEPDRIAAAVATGIRTHKDGCIIEMNALMERHVRRTMPAGAAPAACAEAAREDGSLLQVGKEGVSAKGPIAWMMGGVLSAALLVITVCWVQQKNFAKTVDETVDAKLAVVLRATANMAAEREDKADARAEETRELIREK